MWDKIKMAIGMLIVAFLIGGIAMGIYSRNFAAPEVTIIHSENSSTPIKNALFWYEQGLEKTEPGAGIYLSSDAMDFTELLYAQLNQLGMTNEYFKSMSEKATQKMIELDAYRGDVPDVWALAKENGYPYIFKVAITNAVSKNISDELTSVTYSLQLYHVTDSTLLWDASTTRLSSFFGGMGKSDGTVSAVVEQLKVAHILN